jgi:hypothetical protein
MFQSLFLTHPTKNDDALFAALHPGIREVLALQAQENLLHFELAWLLRSAKRDFHKIGAKYAELAQVADKRVARMAELLAAWEKALGKDETEAQARMMNRPPMFETPDGGGGSRLDGPGWVCTEVNGTAIKYVCSRIGSSTWGIEFQDGSVRLYHWSMLEP